MDVISSLEDLSKALQNPARLERIGSTAAEIIRSRIHDGKGWSPLAPATADYRGSGRPLQDTGALRDSITWGLIDGRTVSVGTNKPYAAIQNSGGVVRAKKNWLWIPGPRLRPLERRYGFKPGEVLKGLKAEGYAVFRMGRTMRYWKKGKKPPKDPGEYPVAYYLKKSVEIPARNFFYLSDADIQSLTEEAGIELNQL